mmetsp:Transcript_10178/g.8983  ORF Transcript_10178/g.8983 Transcript_10178/m.8983 type:complete len:215 (+) Transcript_10178:269-913(+)
MGSGPYRFKLKKKASIYALYADSRPSHGYITMNIIKFMSFNADLIEETDIAPSLREYLDYKGILDTYYPTRGQKKRNPAMDNTRCKVEINIPFENVTHVEICRSRHLTLVPILEMCRMIKESNNLCTFSFLLSCENFKFYNSDILSGCLVANMFSKIKLTSVRDFRQAMKFVLNLLAKNKTLKELIYPKNTKAVDTFMNTSSDDYQNLKIINFD